MKISYETHPSLDILDNKIYNKIKLLPNSSIKSPNEFVHKVVRNGVTKKYYPTKTFNDAFTEAESQFYDFNFIKDLPSQTSIVCFNAFTVAVKIENDATDFIPTFHYCIFTDVGNNSYLIGAGTTMIDCSKHGIRADQISENDFDDISSHNETLQESGGVKAALLKTLLFLLFVKYAKIQTKVLAPKSKASLLFCNYTNSTKSIVTIVNCTWFTTLVKSDAFKVRGHFRLQPKKNEIGEWTKELIWINEFQKTGYTAPARKLSATMP